MSIFNDIVWVEKGNEETCKSNAHEVADYARRFLAVIGHLWDLDQKRSDTELILISLMEFGTKLLHCSVLPVPLKEENYEAKEGGKKTFHFNGSEQNVELILRTVMSANQLSICGAVADICSEVSKDTMASGKPEAHAAQDPWETMEIPTEPPTADPQTDEQRQGNLLQEYEQQFEQLLDAQKLSKLCSNAGLKTVEREQYFITLDTEGPSGMVH